MRSQQSRLAAAVVLLGLAACRPEPPQPERPPEPRATALRDAMQAPLQEARAADQALQDAAARRDAAAAAARADD